MNENLPVVQPEEKHSAQDEQLRGTTKAAGRKDSVNTPNVLAASVYDIKPDASQPASQPDELQLLQTMSHYHNNILNGKHVNSCALLMNPQ